MEQSTRHPYHYSWFRALHMYKRKPNSKEGKCEYTGWLETEPNTKGGLRRNPVPWSADSRPTRFWSMNATRYDSASCNAQMFQSWLTDQSRFLGRTNSPTSNRRQANYDAEHDPDVLLSHNYSSTALWQMDDKFEHENGETPKPKMEELPDPPVMPTSVGACSRTNVSPFPPIRLNQGQSQTGKDGHRGHGTQRN